MTDAQGYPVGFSLGMSLLAHASGFGQGSLTLMEVIRPEVRQLRGSLVFRSPLPV